MSDVWRDEILQLSRQIQHWRMASRRLSKLDMLASSQAWHSLEEYLNTTIRQSMKKSLNELEDKGEVLEQNLAMARNQRDLEAIHHRLNDFRKNYLKTETTLDFYADAINTRTNPELAALLSACDYMAKQSMQSILDIREMKAPPVLTYIDKGLGASILKAGLRLWDGKTQNPVAAIKIVRHNLFRPTALIHESGHQVAHILGWNKELASVLYQILKNKSEGLAEIWSSWASEIAADIFAFVHTGYASVAGLHDVVAGDDRKIFRFVPMDPHPISYLRVLLGIECCRRCFGKGPWDAMEKSWRPRFKHNKLRGNVGRIISQSLSLIPLIARICLEFPLEAFQKQALRKLIPTIRVAPHTLQTLEQRVGPSIYEATYWLSSEALRLLALNGYQIATQPKYAESLIGKQRAWMIRLGNTKIKHPKYHLINN